MHKQRGKKQVKQDDVLLLILYVYYVCGNLKTIYCITDDETICYHSYYRYFLIYEQFFEIEKLCNLSEGPKEILDVFVEHYELWMWDILPNILL